MTAAAMVRGQQVPLADLHWVGLSPAGCAHGSAHADAIGPLAEDAQKVWAPKVADRRREAAEGWRYELVSKDRWEAEVLPCLRSRCGHERMGAGA